MSDISGYTDLKQAAQDKYIASQKTPTNTTSPWLNWVLPTSDPNYQTWYKYSTTTADGAAYFNVMEKAYGTNFVKLSWWALKSKASEAQIEYQLLSNNMIPLAPASSGSGGGGPSKAQQYAAAEAAIRNQAYTLGYTSLTDPEIKVLARTAVNNKWSNEQLMDKLVNDATKDWSKLSGGTLRAAVDAVKAGSAAQLIPVSDMTAQEWAKRLASGEMDIDGLRNLLQTQALARYGWAADVINSGVSMADFLAPSRDRIAQELELNPQEVSLLDSKIMDMVTVVDPKDGRRVASDTELIRAARADERWKSTGNARNTLSQAAMMLRRYVEGN